MGTGASSGTGKAIVEAFVREGANVVAVPRRKERLDALDESLKDEAGTAYDLEGSISKREDDEVVIDKAVELYGRLDVLVDNADIMDDMAPSQR